MNSRQTHTVLTDWHAEWQLDWYNDWHAEMSKLWSYIEFWWNGGWMLVPVTARGNSSLVIIIIAGDVFGLPWNFDTLQSRIKFSHWPKMSDLDLLFKVTHPFKQKFCIFLKSNNTKSKTVTWKRLQIWRFTYFFYETEKIIWKSVRR